MKLQQLYPHVTIVCPAEGIQELMRGFVVRTNFVPGVRHVIGWRGVKQSFAGVEGWTAKIKGFAGVFGIYFDSSRAAMIKIFRPTTRPWPFIRFWRPL